MSEPNPARLSRIDYWVAIAQKMRGLFERGVSDDEVALMLDVKSRQFHNYYNGRDMQPLPNIMPRALESLGQQELPPPARSKPLAADTAEANHKPNKRGQVEMSGKPVESIVSVEAKADVDASLTRLRRRVRGKSGR